MNREEVINLVMEIGASHSSAVEIVERFALEVERRTLERAAKVCDEQAIRSEASMTKSKTIKARDIYSAASQTALWMAVAIRALGEK